MENEKTAVVCAHCGETFSIASHRRRDDEPHERSDARQRRTRLLKCPICHWKFEAPRGGEESAMGQDAAAPHPGRFNI